MSLPLSIPTFYRLPDVYLGGTSITNMLTAVSSSLTSLVDYRGTTIPNTHLWTWATASTGGTFTTIYNTAVPASSSMTLNPTIIFAGTTGSFSPTMTTLDTPFANNTLWIGVNKNGTNYTNWTSSLPMTTGSFTGYQRSVPNGSFATTTFIRTYVSQESIFCVVPTSVGSTQTAYWTYAGAIVEPTTPNTISTASAELDDRIYGMITNGTTANTNTFLTANDGFLYYRGSVFLPSTSTVINISKRNHFNTAVNTNNEIDMAGNYIFEKIRMIRFTGGALIANAAAGTLHGIYYGGATRSNKSTIRNSNDQDLFHIVPYSFTNNSQAIVLKAAV